MEHSLYQVDAFTDTLFCGNPACVVPLKDWLEDAVLLKIAKENAVSETAFFVQDNEEFHLRWFTPDLEMDLCGHATLATAHVLKTHLHFTKGVINFKTISGKVQVVLENDYYVLNFPSRAPLAASLPPLLEQATNIAPKSVFRARDYILVYENESAIKNIEIERNLFDQLRLGTGGVVFTAPGAKVDFVSRFFTPNATLLEDPVTGSAHCSLIPFWASVLNKQKMNAVQLSQRQGFLLCENKKDRVLIGGKAKTYLKGSFQIY